MVLVGVFSREDESTYNWLVKVLVSSRSVNDVRCVAITNRFQNFQEEMEKCDFGILYHTKKRGRVNVTDVVDSLYDEELRLLCGVYGRNNVLVVIDDLESSSEEEKSRILSHQPSIGEFALDLFLFSSADKANLYGSGYQSSTSALRALEEMKRIIKGAKNRASIPGGERWTDGHISAASGPRMNRRCMVVFIACVAIAGIILIIVLSTSHLRETTIPHTTVAPARHVTISNWATTPYNHSSE
ncbi:uncharacterized protein LOC143785046 [Ranitomeya variabilis]|uniref:uncharacterized protein LOC143785046 n=1 Tax=Ranitomeya variabilis TaxID=490064 RepID=UPI004057045B